jgi:catechol 2,3-dioxygenase-like lactoylglutathione lyase family enzyme
MMPATATPAINQQVTFIYTRDLAAGSAFLKDKLGLEMVLNQSDLCHIYRVTGTTFLGICTNRQPPKEPGLTYSLVTSDVDGLYEAWSARGVVFDGPPEFHERFNVYSAFFTGPEGYRFEIQEFRNPAWPTA